MQFIVSSQALLRKLQNIAGIISSSPNMMIADNFLVELEGNTLHLTATDIDTVMKTNCDVIKGEHDGAVCIPSRILLDYLKNMPEQPLNISVDDDNNIDISSDKGKYKLKGESASKFPRSVVIENPETVTIPATILNDGIADTLFAVSTDEMKKSMNGIFIEIKDGSLNFVSTDLQRLVKYSYTAVESQNVSGIIVPRKPMSQVKNILPSDNSEVTISFNEQFFFLQSSEVDMMTRLVDGKFPDYNIAIPESSPYQLEVNRSDLESALKRINIFANKSTNQILFNITTNNIMLTAEDIDFSYQGNETVACNYDGDEIKLSFNAKLLLELIHNLPADEVVMKFSTPIKAVVFEPASELSENENLLMLMMPLLIRHDD